MYLYILGYKNDSNSRTLLVISFLFSKLRIVINEKHGLDIFLSMLSVWGWTLDKVFHFHFNAQKSLSLFFFPFNVSKRRKSQFI